LQREGIPILTSLPVIAGQIEAKLRSKDAVVDRAIALLIVAVKGEGLAQPTVDKIREMFAADGYFTPLEKVFILDQAPSEKSRMQFVWRYECLGVLHWALGYVDQLAPPSRPVDADLMVKLLREAGPGRYRSGARMRTATEILDEADLIYRYDWACVNARVKGAASPRGIDCDVIVERHRALNWLYSYQGQAWDEVSTDT
jgi:hypothetical protein